MRLVIRIGGSVVASPVNTELMNKYADIIQTVRQQGHEVVVVLGGGALAREFISVARNLHLDMTAQDEIAISCSRLFAQLFLKKLGEAACNKVAVTLDETAQCLGEGKIVVMGGLRPNNHHAAAMLVAERSMSTVRHDQTAFTIKTKKHPNAKA
jgi:uridylate kinase